jgi:endonuclease/exonuclease/phosphatase family metal-dependent hydrolase
LNQAHATLRRLLPAIIAALAFALLLPGSAAAKQKGHHHGLGKAKMVRHHPHGHGHHGKDRGRGKVAGVMTRNIYLGADLTPAIFAPSLKAFAAANGKILREVTANDFPTRAEGLAEEILETKPDLVGLQEVALWRTAPVNPEVLTKGPSATTVRYDYLQLLLDELNAGKGKSGHGKPQYSVVISQNEFDLEAPADENGKAGDGPGGELADAEINGRLTMRDVILVRHGAGVQTWNEQSANFANPLPVKILGATVPILRGWTATDAKVRGSGPFRFVNTHLEAFEPNFRALQAGELVAPSGPATSELPVVLVGDLNSDDDTVTGADQLAYNLLLGAGMVSRSTNNPLSCCLDSSLLAVKAAEEAGAGIDDFDHQVDHILTRDPDQVTLKSSTVTGLQPVNGFWNSDHAGVFSELRFQR